jgi:dihydrodipicolinate synthase/N-acetylneuraminate lyase
LPYIGKTVTTTPAFEIDGIIPIIPTPFTADEQIDSGALADLVEFGIAAGAWGVCLPAYASEFYKLSELERLAVVETAVEQARGRVPVIAQVNYYSARAAASAAQRAQELGATAICAAVPRLFAVGEADLLRFFDRILSAISVPLIIQDFNPGGASISAAFIADLHRMHPHFRYVKLEEGMMRPKVEAIRSVTSGEVGVLEGWGGMYMPELIPAGVCGVMPALSLTDVLARIYRLLREGRREEAYPIFQGVVPQIVYSLQNLELFHHAEKLLLADRGVLENTTVRELRIGIGEKDLEYIRFLNGRVLELLDSLQLPRNPLAVSGSRRP